MITRFEPDTISHSAIDCLSLRGWDTERTAEEVAKGGAMTA